MNLKKYIYISLEEKERYTIQLVDTREEIYHIFCQEWAVETRILKSDTPIALRNISKSISTIKSLYDEIGYKNL